LQNFLVVCPLPTWILLLTNWAELGDRLSFPHDRGLGCWDTGDRVSNQDESQ